jgi:hypothetical protein
MTKKRIITIDEFFTYKEMFSGLLEDRALACEIYNNANYQDKEIIDKLMAKALLFKDRVDFCIAVEYSFEIGSFNTNRVYAYIEKSKADKVYMEILRKIKDND